MADPRSHLYKVTAELHRREREALRLYTPQSQQAAIFTTTARRLVIRGGNQSGKTLSGAKRVADIATGYDLHGVAGKTKGLRLLLVSLDFSLMSENIYRKLFEPGAFDVCETCLRVRHLCDSRVGGDGACEVDESSWDDRRSDADPLIPPRFLKEIAWLDKRRGIPARAVLKTGVVMDFRSTDQGRAKFQGVQWDFFWGDEEATNDEEIMSEIERGLIKRKGYGQITATPLAASLTLVNWSERAQEERAERDLLLSEGKPLPAHPPFYEEVQLFTDDNVALDQRELEKFYEDMGEEEEAVRRRGEFLIQQGLVYGREFDKHLHIVDTFKVPQEWTLYEIQDPGHAVAFATLYWAVNPEGDHYLCDELYLRRLDIPEVVRRQKKLLRSDSPSLAGWHHPQRSIVDPAAKQVAAGMKGRSVLDQLHAERKRQKHYCWQGKFKCYKAHNEVQAGIFAVKALMKPRENGKPRLFVMRHLNHFLREIRRYRWPRPPIGKDLVEKAGPIKKDDHLMDTLRYGALSKLQYVPPEQRPGWGANPRLKRSIEDFRKRKKRKKEREANSAYSLS